MSDDEKNLEIDNNNVKTSKPTAFLIRNEIWFKTVLTLAVTVAALFVSVSSCSTAQHQAQLSAITTQNLEKEKQPFFSIKLEYEEVREQYIYRIVNTGGEVRYAEIMVFPYLQISQSIRNQEFERGAIDSPYINQSFISLPGFYEPEPTIDDDEVIAFTDIWLDNSLKFDNRVQKKDSLPELANDYFSKLSGINNSSEGLTYMHSDIIYIIQISYTDYKNESYFKRIALDRSSDMSGLTQGNNRLYISSQLDDWLTSAREEGNYLEVDAHNLPIEDIVKECCNHIDSLFISFGQTDKGVTN